MNTNIGGQIKKIRTQRGMTQEDLARKADISYVTLVKIEQGKSENPKIKTLHKIAKVLGVKVDTFLVKDV